MSLIPSYFLDTVAALGTPAAAGGDDIRYFATAFVFGYPGSPSTKPVSYWVFVVTNRHVVKGQDQMWIRFHAPAGQRPKVLPIPRGPRPFPWVLHPDPDIDLAVLPTAAIEIPDGLDPDRFLTLRSHTVTIDDLRSSEFSEGNELFILGFPMGIAGTDQNDVIVRHGIVARIQDWYDGRSKDFLIDSSIYPGNSGGPVILKPVLWGFGKGRRFTTPKIIGLVSGYLPYRDVARSEQTGLVRLIAEENSGLATVVPMNAVIELTSILARVMDESTASGQQTVSWEAFADAMGAATDDAASSGSTADPVGGTE